MLVVVAFAFLVLLGLANLATMVQAGDSDLDPTFNGTGKVTTPVGSFEDRAYAVALQADGKLVVVGNTNNGLPPQFHNDFAVVRYNADGSLDTSFGSGGKVTTSVGSSDDYAKGVSIQSDGRIVVVGFSSNGSNNDFAAVRYNTDGSLDTSFGSGGKVTTPVGTASITPHDEAYSVVIQPDGKIVAAGYARMSGTDYDFAVVRYETNGSLDTSFGAGGKVTTPVGPSTADDRASAVALQTDGKILAVGSGGGSYGDIAVVRYNMNGSLDTSFGPSGSGIVTTPVGTTYDVGRAVATQTDGKIVVAGYFVNSSFGQDFAIVRYDTNGSLDTSFDSDGKVTTTVSGGFDVASGIATQADGKILVVGYNDLSSGDFELVRYNTNGSLDASFGTGGKVVTSIGSRDVANAVVVQPDGKIVAAGYSFISDTGDDFALVRYSGTATPTPTPSPSALPVILIPGNPGSKLDLFSNSGSHNNIWPGAGGLATYLSLDQLSLNPSDANIFSTGIIRRDPDDMDIYDSLINKLLNQGGYNLYDIDREQSRPAFGRCDLSQMSAHPTLFVFPYDWRQDITKNTNQSLPSNLELLGQYVHCIRQFYPGTQVNILTHSTGGLLARRYIMSNPNDVNKLITIAAPWLGAAKAIDVLETGHFLDLDANKGSWLKRAIAPIDQFFLDRKFEGLVKFFPGVHQLLPSQKYFALTIPPYIKDGRALNYDDFVRSLDEQFSESTPGTTGKIFHDTPLQDDWSDPSKPANTLVKYFHIYGVMALNQKPERKTIVQVIDRRESDCNLMAGFACQVTPDFTYEYGNGDGTVPLASASRRAGSINLNAPNANVFRPPLPSASGGNAEVEHGGLVRNPQVQNAILCLLGSTTPAQVCINNLTQGQQQSSQRSLSDVDEQPPSQPAYYLKLRGAGTVTVSDNAGNSVTPFPLYQTTGDGLPNVTSDISGEKSAQFVISMDQDYTITFRTTSSPLSLELTVAGDVTTQAVRYKDIVLPANVIAILKLHPQGIDALLYDVNADGIFESTVAPTVLVTGTAAQDTDPPSLEINATKQANSSLVTITSSDVGSGVKATYFSLNGTNFQPYTAPFTVNQYQAPTIYAFADDNVGNRSGLVTYRLINLGVPVLVSEANSTRAIALDSVLWLPEPFHLTYDHLWGTDSRTRIMLFAMNFELAQGEGASAVTATAQDGSNRIYPLTVEYVGKVPGAEWLTSVVVRLNDELGDVGDVLVRITYHGNVSNAVRLGIGHVGGGPPNSAVSSPRPLR
jgi:uncharacterized delta-60 repeat protein